MVVCKFVLPHNYGDTGKPIPLIDTHNFLIRVTRTHGGLTLTPHAEGWWLNDDDEFIRENVTLVEVATCNPTKLGIQVIEMGKQFRQKSVYIQQGTSAEVITVS